MVVEAMCGLTMMKEQEAKGEGEISGVVKPVLELSTIRIDITGPANKKRFVSRHGNDPSTKPTPSHPRSLPV